MVFVKAKLMPKMIKHLDNKSVSEIFSEFLDLNDNTIYNIEEIDTKNTFLYEQERIKSLLSIIELFCTSNNKDVLSPPVFDHLHTIGI